MINYYEKSIYFIRRNMCIVFFFALDVASPAKIEYKKISQPPVGDQR